MSRPSDREAAQVSGSITRHFTKHAEGSVLVELATPACSAPPASTPAFRAQKGQGGVTAEPMRCRAPPTPDEPRSGPASRAAAPWRSRLIARPARR